MNQRGDVVIVTIPYAVNGGAKDRPAVVVQCDRLNQKLATTIVAGITTNIARVATEPTQFLVDPVTPDGKPSGLFQASAVKCENLFTVSSKRVKKTIGRLSGTLLQKLEASLKATLELQ